VLNTSSDFLRAVGFADVGEFSDERAGGGAVLKLLKVGTIAGAEVAGGAQFERRDIISTRQLFAGFDQEMEAFICADAGEIADDARVVGVRA
jgi:hypothetical protein